MKKIKTLCTAAFSALGILALILDTQTAVSAAREGIELCIRTIIPALFPFFILSSLLTGAISQFRIPVLRPLGALCRMPSGSEPLLLLGLLGGYPAGAQNVTQCHSQGKLPANDARRLLGFCSNAGPAFLFGVAASQFPEKWMAWCLWGVHIAGAVLTGVLLSGSSREQTRLDTGNGVTVSQALDTGLRTTARVCGWVILFRVLLGFLTRWLFWRFSDTTQVLLTGLAELSLGCLGLSRIENVGLRFVICAVLLGFGGLCVLMQTYAVTGKLGLGSYLPGKLLHGLLSFQLSYQLQYLLLGEEERWSLPPWVIFFIWFALFLVKLAVAIPRIMVYNPDIFRKPRSFLCFFEKIFPKPATTAPMAHATKRG